MSVKQIRKNRNCVPGNTVSRYLFTSTVFAAFLLFDGKSDAENHFLAPKFNNYTDCEPTWGVFLSESIPPRLFHDAIQ